MLFLLLHGPPDNLVPGKERKLGVRQVTVDHMKVGAADRARRNFDKHLAGTETRRLPLNQPEGIASSFEHHRLHGIGLPDAVNVYA
jgi:hypothetical protein